MRLLVSLSVLVGLATVGLCDNWAVVVSGGAGWYNYGLQSDAYHAYHVLLNHGVSADKIITMLVDDLALNDENPFPGKIFNEPNGQDVYGGVKFDYSGDDVTPANFLAVLRGDSKGVKGGNGRVLQSTKDDKVFVYFVDHGDSGVICFPDDVVSAQDLNDTLATMNANGMYDQLLIYIDACYSGSMFDGILPDNVNIYAMTAANSSQVAWFNFCDIPVIDVCLGTYFSHGWISNSEATDLNGETLGQQYQIVHDQIDNANVSNYGDYSMKDESVATFLGSKAQAKGASKAAADEKKWNANEYASYSKHELPIRHLEAKLRKTKAKAQREKLEAELRTMKQKRAFHDHHTRLLVSRLVKERAARHEVLESIPAKITQLKCHNDAVKLYHSSCFNLGKSPYAQNAVRALANLCESGIPAGRIMSAIKSQCSRPARFTEIH